MPGTTSGRWALPYSQGADAANTIDSTMQSLAEKLRDEGVQFSQGTLASRPTSTGGSPGKTGRFYYATDTDQLFYDMGTAWEQVRPDESLAAYQNILQAQGIAQVDLSAGTYFVLNTPSQIVSHALVGSGSSMTFVASANNSDIALPALYLDDADYSIPGRTTKLRVRAQVSTNATQPTITFTFGLYPVTFAGAADTLVPTLGTVVPGSTVAIASPAASTTTPGNSGDFTFPSDGLYALGVVTSAGLTNNNMSLLTAQLQRHWV